jgi:hypothetical protein
MKAKYSSKVASYQALASKTQPLNRFILRDSTRLSETKICVHWLHEKSYIITGFSTESETGL